MRQHLNKLVRATRFWDYKGGGRKEKGKRLHLAVVEVEIIVFDIDEFPG